MDQAKIKKILIALAIATVILVLAAVYVTSRKINEENQKANSQISSDNTKDSNGIPTLQAQLDEMYEAENGANAGNDNSGDQKSLDDQLKELDVSDNKDKKIEAITSKSLEEQLAEMYPKNNN